MKEQLTAPQQALVESTLRKKNKNGKDIVELVIVLYAKYHTEVPGLEYDDLYQVGCVGLCRAATLYNGSTKFETYARYIIRTEIANYIRSIVRQEKYRADGEIDFLRIVDEENQYNAFGDDFLIAQMLHYLEQAKKEQSKCIRQGFEAIELRIKGFNGTQIAQMFNTEPNKVTAWISKARQKMRDDDEFQKLIAEIRC